MFYLAGMKKAFSGGEKKDSVVRCKSDSVCSFAGLSPKSFFK